MVMLRLKWLLAQGNDVNINLANKDGETALSIAQSQSSKKGILDLFEQYQAFPNKTKFELKKQIGISG